MEQIGVWGVRWTDSLCTEGGSHDTGHIPTVGRINKAKSNISHQLILKGPVLRCDATPQLGQPQLDGWQVCTVTNVTIYDNSQYIYNISKLINVTAAFSTYSWSCGGAEFWPQRARSFDSENQRWDRSRTIEAVRQLRETKHLWSYSEPFSLLTLEFFLIVWQREAQKTRDESKSLPGIRDVELAVGCISVFSICTHGHFR